MEVIRHAKNRFQVLGSIAVVAGRIVHEPYSRVFNLSVEWMNAQNAPNLIPVAVRKAMWNAREVG